MTRRDTAAACSPSSDNLLSIPQIRALCAWRERHGTLVLTREPEPGRNLLRWLPAVVPLVETFDRVDCARLLFQRHLIEKGKVAR